MRLLIVMFCLFPFCAPIGIGAQINFIKGFPGADGMWVETTPDGGYILCGRDTAGALQLVRTDLNGDTTWTRQFKHPNVSLLGVCVQPLSGGGFVVAGWGSGDFLLVRTDANGDTLWVKTYGRPSASESVASVRQNADGGFIIAGSGGAFFAVRTDANGDTLWTRAYGGFISMGCTYGEQTSDGGFIFGGTFHVGGTDHDLLLVKTNANGDTLWTRRYGTAYAEFCGSLRETSDGGFILCGKMDGGLYNEAFLLKTDASGIPSWAKNYTGGNIHDARNVIETSDAGFAFFGSTYASGPPDTSGWTLNYYLVRTDAMGDTLWTGVYGDSAFDEGYGLSQCPDGGFVCIGKTGIYETRFFRTDITGYVECHRYASDTEVNPFTMPNSPAGIQLLSTAGTITSRPGLQINRGVIITTHCTNVGIPETNCCADITISPNPFTGNASLSIGQGGRTVEIFDMSGRRVSVTVVPPGVSQITVGEGLAPGVYSVHVATGQVVQALKIIKTR